MHLLQIKIAESLSFYSSKEHMKTRIRQYTLKALEKHSKSVCLSRNNNNLTVMLFSGDSLFLSYQSGAQRLVHGTCYQGAQFTK